MRSSAVATCGYCMTTRATTVACSSMVSVFSMAVTVAERGALALMMVAWAHRRLTVDERSGEDHQSKRQLPRVTR
jgi:hypothetical protein